MPLYFFLQINEPLRRHHFLEPFLASFPARQIQQHNPGYRSDRCRQHINKELPVMLGDECNQEEIVADRKKEKRRIQDAQDDES